MTVYFLFLFYFSFVFLSFAAVNLRWNDYIKSKNVLLIIIPLMIYTVVTRPDTLPDINGYVDVIIYDADIRWEPTFFLFRYLGKLSNDPVAVVFLCYATISVVGRIYYLNKISPYLWTSMLVYSSYYFVYNDMIQIRAAVATMLLYPLFICAYNKNPKAFFPICLLAISFHYSAAIYFFIYFLNSHEINKKIWLSLLLFGFIFALSGFYLSPVINYITWGPIHSLFDHYYNNVEWDENVNVLSILHIGQVLCALFILANIDKTKYISPYLIISLKLFILGLFIKTAFSDLPIVANRSSELFTSVEIFLIPCFLYAYFRKKLVAVIATVMYSAIFFTYSIKTWF